MSRSPAGWMTAVLTMLAVSLAPRAACADDAHEKAAAAFADARRFIDQGNCEAALPKLRESLQHESSIGARLSIADCVEKQDPKRAWRVLKEAAALALMNRDERLAVCEERARALESNLLTIQFRLPPEAEQFGFELRVDGEVVDRYLLRSGVATSGGSHVVEASAPGRRFAGRASGDVGSKTTVDVVLGREDCRAASAPAVVNSPPAIAVDRGATRRALGLSLGGLGLAGLATGIVFGVLTLDKKQAIEGACGGNLGECAARSGSVDAETEAARTSAAISTVSFAVGGAALLGGAVIWLTAPSAPSDPPRTGLRLQPRAVSGGGGLGLAGAW